MQQTREALAQHLAERLCWQVAQRDDARVARRLYRRPVVDGVYQLDDGALRDDVCACLQPLGVGAWLGEVQGPAVQRERGPFVHDLLLDRLKTRLGLERMQALPALLCSDEARMRLVGVKAQPVRPGVCQRGALHRQGPRTTGPLGAEALADKLVQLHLRALEAWCNGGIRALATGGVLATKVTGIVAATDLEPTAQSTGCGHVTRRRKRMDTRGQVQALEVTVSGWKLIGLLEARPNLPLAATVVLLQEHDTRSLRALVTPARTNLAGHARRHKGVFDQGCVAGVDVWGLDHQGLLCVGPATPNLAGTVDAQAHAAAGDGSSVARRGQTVRHGQGNTASTERLETAVGGRAGLTTEAQSGTPEPGRHAKRRDFEPNPRNAVVVRPWHHRDDGPGGHTVVLTTAPVEKPLQPFDDDEDRRLIEHGCLKERTPPWSVQQPPQNTARAVHVHVMFTVRLFALATAYRRPCAQADIGPEPVGWQRWRRQLLEQARDHVIVCAQNSYGLLHRAEDSLLLGVKLKDVPPGLGTRQEMLATDGLTAHG